MLNCKNKLCIDDILKIYQSGCKDEQKIGMEYERILVNDKTDETASYYGLFGICELLKEFAEIDNWDYILDNNEIIGLKKLHDTITLEPGAQIEYSITPEYSVSKLKNKIDKIDSALNSLFDKYELKFINYGISPITTYKNIKLIPKRRYKCMAEYLWGILSDVMMRETAGIQIGIDFSSEEDAMKKMYIANKLSPFMTAMFANSSKRGGVDTGYKSFRALAWLNTDNERCGFATKLSPSLTFMDYINSVLKSPMIFIYRENKLIQINGKISFEEFMHNGYEGFEAEMDDYLLHSNLFFPDVRLRNFIEIRNHDSIGEGRQYAIPAIYKGIFYSDTAMEEIKQLLNKITEKDIKEFRYSVPKFGLETKINGILANDIAKEIKNIAYQSLKENKDEDAKYILY